MKKLTTGKIWQFAAGQFGWAMLSGIISNWLVYFYQPDKTAISQGQTVFIPQGLVVFGIFTIIGGITAFGRIFDAFTDPMIASLSDRCTSKNGRRIPFLKWASLPLALSTVLVFWVRLMKLYKTKKNCGKLLLGILAFCTGMILLTGCGSSSEQKQNKNEETAEENKEEDKVQIGLTVDSFVIERWIRDRDVFVATARELGAEVNVQDAGADVKEQISQIEYFINKQVDVIVVIARDCGALSDAIQKAQSAGISVISYDRMVNNANTDLYISFDNRKVGEIMAQALVNALPQGGDVFMIQGSSSDNNVQMVKQGFDDMLADTDLHVVYEANCDGWTAELAAGYVEEALEKYPHVKGIMCGNDDIASQVVQVLAENQLAGNVVVVGQDGDLAACQRIVEGTQYMTAFKPIEDLARKAAKYAVEMGSGKGVAELEDVTETVNDGTYEIPSCILEPTAVTKENIDKVIIEGGFHRRDEVYLNADYS